MRNWRAERVQVLSTLVAGAVLAGAGCGGKDAASTPTGPTVDVTPRVVPLRLSTERYLLELQGFDGPESLSLPACSPILVPAGGKHVTTFVWFEEVGGEWVGRSRPPYGATIEIRLRGVGSAPGTVFVEGTLRGSVPDEYDRVWGLRDSVFRTYDSATLDGLVTPGVGSTWLGHQVSGVVRGDLIFHDRRGFTSACTYVRYWLQVRPPGGPDDDPTVPPYVDGVLELRSVDVGAGAPSRRGPSGRSDRDSP